ncbi:TonB-dependent receptor [Proteobacteria bacterium 005FR1]|nr:TonB-dependent receptor [Proteobacteria bacterium 005FR1]
MKLNPIYKGIMACALAIPAGAFAQQGSGGQVLEEIIVTGSLIRGTPEDSAMPVDTISNEEMELQGSPPPLEMLKSLSYMNGIVGEANNFTSGRGQAAQGTASVNLRGLGSERTLVLLNGKRLAASDANRLPTNAIARVEVLKDGGAVTYGSDAIAGVVNYITKETQEGFELNADYRAIDGSDGDYNLGVSWGTATDSSDFFVSLNYYHRSELEVPELDYAIQPYSRNPEGGWGSGANPGAFRGAPDFGFDTTTGEVTGLARWPIFVDPECEEYGVLTTSTGTPATAANGTTCRTQYTQWYNLIDEQDTWQAFSSYSIALGDDTDFKIEALYASTEVDHASSAPSYTTANYVPNQINPFGAFADSSGTGLNPFYSISPNNPYLQAFAAANGVDLTSQLRVAGGGTPRDPSDDVYVPSPNTALNRAFIQLNQWRPYFMGGNPAFGYEGAWTNYEREQYRLSAELQGLLGDNIGYRTSLTYSQSEDFRQEWDIRIDKLQAALNGLAGVNCDGTTPGANGCLWLNPFATAYPQEGASDATIQEQVAVAQWLMEQHGATNTDELVEFNFVLDGDLGVELSGGTIGWAAGVQYRHEATDQDYSDISNQELNPCPIYGSDYCVGTDLQGASPWLFLATYVPYDIDREVKAVFGEFMIPITDNFTAQLAARFEDYGDVGGSSFDPNLRLRWQANDWLAFRASAGTTFRAPSQAALRPVVSTGFAPIKGNSTPILSRGNPDLEPEEATNYNIGVMFSTLNFEGSIDYWRFNIDQRLSTEPRTGIVETFWPTGGNPNCGSPLIDRINFSGTCGEDDFRITGVKVNQINGGEIVNDGIDINGRYTWDEVGNGALSLGASATWINKYETEGVMVEGILVEEGFDGVGKFNLGTSLFPLPEWRGSAFLDYAMDRQNIRWTMNYVDSYEDTRDIFTSWAPEGQTIDSHLTHNITYRLDVNDNVTVSAVIDNVTDEEPPFVRAEMNYDPVTHNPLTRTFKLGAKVRF